MKENDLIQMREWDRLQYYHPADVLKNFRKLDHLVAEWSLPDNVRTLRRNDLRGHREGRDAALFCLGMTSVQGRTVFFARLTRTPVNLCGSTSWTETLKGFPRSTR